MGRGECGGGVELEVEDGGVGGGWAAERRRNSERFLRISSKDSILEGGLGWFEMEEPKENVFRGGGDRGFVCLRLALTSLK